MVFFTGVIGLLAGLGHYSILVIVLFCSIVMAVFMFRTEYLLYYYLVLGALTFPGAFDRLGGLVTLNWGRTTFLAGIYFLYSLLFIRNIRDVVKVRDGKRFLIGIFPWVGYLGITIAWAISPVDSMRYYPKFVMAAFLALALLLDKRISSKQCVKMLTIGAVIFLVVSTMAIPFSESLWPNAQNYYFEGYSGRHPSKFYLVFIALLALALWLVNKRKKLPVLLLSYSFVMLVWIVQRGAIFALILGGLAVFIVSIRKVSLSFILKGVLSLGLIILGIYILFYTPEFQESMFIAPYGPDQFFGYLLKGNVGSAIDLINFKGRFEIWRVARELQETFLGKGFGTTPVYIKLILGRYNELHNDMLQYLIETGYLGFALYLLMWLSMFGLGYKYRKSEDDLLKISGLSLCGYTVALFAWSFVEHVFDFAHMSGVYLFIMAAVIVKRRLEKHEKRHTGTDDVLAVPVSNRQKTALIRAPM
jgi:O-antigen ligase